MIIKCPGNAGLNNRSLIIPAGNEDRRTEYRQDALTLWEDMRGTSQRDNRPDHARDVVDQFWAFTEEHVYEFLQGLQLYPDDEY